MDEVVRSPIRVVTDQVDALKELYFMKGLALSKQATVDLALHHAYLLASGTFAESMAKRLTAYQRNEMFAFGQWCMTLPEDVDLVDQSTDVEFIATAKRMNDDNMRYYKRTWQKPITQELLQPI